MSAEDSVQQAAFGALGGLGPVQVWGARTNRAKNIQLPETSRLYHLQGRQEDVEAVFWFCLDR